MVLAKLTNPGHELGLSVLRHGGEQVVLNLAVQVAHPPVDEGVRVDVDGVVDAVFDPVLVLVGPCGRQVGVVQAEVAEQVHAAHKHGHVEGRQTHQNRPVRRARVKVRHVAQDHKQQSHRVTPPLPQDVFLGVEVEVPEEDVEHRRQRQEGQVLVADPPSRRHGSTTTALQRILVEGDEGQRVDVEVVVLLLWSGMVFVVHVVPLPAVCDEAEGDEDGLDGLVHRDDARQGVVAALVLDPPRPAASQAPDEHGQQHRPPGARLEQHEAHHEHRDDLHYPEGHVRQVGLEPALRHQVAPQLSVVGQHLLRSLTLFHGLVGGPGGQRLEDLVGPRTALVESDVGIGGVLVGVVGDDGAAGVPLDKVGDVVYAVTHLDLDAAGRRGSLP
mmetsp:Transcript_49401/g.123907  ORF Transcript_49401/g.123907 Transcript_49401/m.123907 type:complete len:386 (+) Transcript_49401:262-1419(+)